MAVGSIRPRLAFAFGAILILILLAALPATVFAEDILIEGFEGDTSGWFGQNYGLDGCAAHSGAHAMKLTSTGGAPGQLATQIEGDRPASNYSLTVSALRLSGPGQVVAQLTWYAADGQQLRVTTRNVTADAGSYTTTASDFVGPPQGSARIKLTLGLPAQSPGSVCIDDVRLEGPAEQANTPTPTKTLTPQPTATPPSPTATKPATSTPSPSPTAATAKATSTTKPSAAEAGLAGGSLVNGGFEDGLAGWQKFGGELRAVAEPHDGGASAAAFVSTTASTKWAYQVVTVDAGATYVFSGHVDTDAGVESAYLRISWYTSSDGGGSAIAQVDSTSSVSGASSGFVQLTTGAVQTPDGAHSARLRAMLDPVGAATATLYLDDFAFASAAADAPVRASSQASGSDEADAAAPNSAPASLADSGFSRSQALGSGADAATEAQAGDTAEAPPTARIGNGDWASTYVYFAAIALFVLAGGGAYALAKRWPLTLRK